MLVHQGGENSERILRLEDQIQLLVNEDLTKIGRTSVFLKMKGVVNPS